VTLEGDGSLATYADASALSPFGFNDIVVDGRGNAYINSGNFDFTGGPPDGTVQPGFVALVKIVYRSRAVTGARPVRRGWEPVTTSPPPRRTRPLMQKISLDAAAREQLEIARSTAAARSSATIYGGHEHALRQTVVALLAGASLGEHENPGEATVHVLTGRVQLTAGTDMWEGRTGDLLVIPDARHGLHAVEDSVVLLTAVPRGHTH
jgi:quercetin dioxygenase-like cupin family protein